MAAFIETIVKALEMVETKLQNSHSTEQTTARRSGGTIGTRGTRGTRGRRRFRVLTAGALKSPNGHHHRSNVPQVEDSTV